jgi:hypothetical protein
MTQLPCYNTAMNQQDSRQSLELQPNNNSSTTTSVPDAGSSQTAMELHQSSVQKYPDLNLSKDEYVISVIKRHPIGLAQLWLGVVVVIALLIGFMALFFADPGGVGSSITLGNSQLKPIIALVLLGICLLAVAGGMVGTYVYQKNTMYLTNESVIQNIQTSLLSNREQTVSLENVEDVSYLQSGALSHFFNFGSIRLSTRGDETTYRMNYVAYPKRQIAVLNNAVEDFMNDRPVSQH